MSIARERPCVHTQKLNRRTSLTSLGIPFACATRSRKYCQGNDTPRFGFAFSQCWPSVFQSSQLGQSSEGNQRPVSRHFSHGSSPAMKANQVSFSMVPSSTLREYSWWCQQTEAVSYTHLRAHETPEH